MDVKEREFRQQYKNLVLDAARIAVKSGLLSVAYEDFVIDYLDRIIDPLANEDFDYLITNGKIPVRGIKVETAVELLKAARDLIANQNITQVDRENLNVYKDCLAACVRDFMTNRQTSTDSYSPTSENSNRATHHGNRATSSGLESELTPNMNLATSPALNPQTSAPFEAQSANRTTSYDSKRTMSAGNQEADSTDRTLMFNSNVPTSQHLNTTTSSHLEDVTTSLQADAMSHPAKLSMSAKVATSPLLEIADLQQRIFKAADILDAMSPDDPDLPEYTKIYQALWDRLRELEQGGTDHA
ncbi:hypothetical protein [Paenibacillus massiliensis]|uniref:hypothetical protein n=1 Tax=Paenibacillus massiliensis TaxID=225917 RepID=UPI000471B191|nr:hypothetical protein [Paenibacillus massiliensis]